MTEHSHIPLKPSIAGMQYAGWEPSTGAMHGLGQRMLPDQAIPVADGVTLHADVYLPHVEGRYPAVVSFGGYSTERLTAGIPSGSNEVGSPPVFTDRGYAPVIVERRGMGRSTGESVTFFDPQDVDDHERVIEWAAAQPWCTGDVVLFGTSYYGMDQPAVAARKPPALKAFFANEICTDLYRQFVYFGGVPDSTFLGLWLGANFTESDESRRITPDARAAISHLANGPLHTLLEKAVHKNVDRMFRHFLAATPEKYAREIFARWMFDAKTREDGLVPDVSSEVLGDVEVPFVVIQNPGYLNLHQYGSYDLFENAGTPADRKWLIVGPAVYDLPVYAWQLEAIAFFDHIVRGVDNGYEAQPGVRYWREGAESFATATMFPPDGSERLRLELESGGADAVTHALTTGTASAGANSWAAVPIGVPVIGGLDEVANQTLSFELPIDQPTELAGAVTANLAFSCNEIDSYVVARLSRIDVAGERHQLSMGVIRPVARTIDEARSTSIEIAIDSGIREPLVPGEKVTLRFSLTPFPSVLQPGERLRLDVASRTDLLRMSPGDGFPQFDLPVPPYFSRNTLHFGGASWIEIDRVPVRDAVT